MEHTELRTGHVAICPICGVKMMKKRYIQHTVKCAEKYPDVMKGLQICPFNAKHYIPVAEWDEHLLTCPSQTKIDGRTSDACQPRVTGNLSVPPSTGSRTEASTDQWPSAAHAASSTNSSAPSSNNDFVCVSMPVQSASSLPRPHQRLKFRADDSSQAVSARASYSVPRSLLERLRKESAAEAATTNSQQEASAAARTGGCNVHAKVTPTNSATNSLSDARNPNSPKLLGENPLSLTQQMLRQAQGRGRALSGLRS